MIKASAMIKTSAPPQIALASTPTEKPCVGEEEEGRDGELPTLMVDTDKTEAVS